MTAPKILEYELTIAILAVFVYIELIEMVK